MVKKNMGRPLKVNYMIMARLEDALRNGASVSEACKYAGISRDTYYRYMNNEDVFAKRIKAARNKHKLLAEFRVF